MARGIFGTSSGIHRVRRRAQLRGETDIDDGGSRQRRQGKPDLDTFPGRRREVNRKNEPERIGSRNGPHARPTARVLCIIFGLCPPLLSRGGLRLSAARNRSSPKWSKV